MIGLAFILKMAKKKNLKSVPMRGATTDHEIIPFGKGICGQVAVSNEEFCGAGCKFSGQLHCDAV